MPTYFFLYVAFSFFRGNFYFCVSYCEVVVIKPLLFPYFLFFVVYELKISRKMKKLLTQRPELNLVVVRFFFFFKYRMKAWKYEFFKSMCLSRGGSGFCISIHTIKSTVKLLLSISAALE